jgi:carbamoyltransferase
VLPLSKSNLKVTSFSSEKEMIAYVAQLIIDEKIVGWAQGRFENGPRGLGARSILTQASSVNAALKLSVMIKTREKYRPYACSLTPDAAQMYLEFHSNEIPLLAKWMLCSVKVKTEHRNKLRAAMHIDNTTRPQVVYRDENPIYFNLLKELGKRTGVEAVLNTSFNEAGFPVVNTPTEALVVFARTAMDALVVQNFLIERTHD